MNQRHAFDATVVLKQLSEDIAADERELAVIEARLRDNRAAAKALEKIAGAKAAAKQIRVVSGSLEDRILSACREPQPMAVIIEAAKARRDDVVATVKTLVTAKRIVKTGHSTATRYQAK